MGFSVSASPLELRFQPTTWPEYEAAVWTFWNLLDRNILRHYIHGVPPKNPYGYIRPVQLKAYAQSVWQDDHVQMYCEVGVNGGHGTAAMLLANSHMHVVSFDYGAWTYSNSTIDLLDLYFGSRFQFVQGPSQKTIPEFIARNPGVQCDVLLVDGGHAASVAVGDLRQFARMAACNATVFVDDLNENHGPGSALRAAEREGLVTVVEWHMYNASHTYENPCLRTPIAGRLNCLPEWGWARAMYSGAHACNRDRTRDGTPGRPAQGRVEISKKTRASF